MTYARSDSDAAPAPGGRGGCVLLIGSGDRLYREYALAAMARTHDLVLLQPERATWQRPYVFDDVAVRLDDPAAALAAARDCLERHDVRGVLTYDETRVRLAAEIAAQLGIAHLDAAAAARCRDKLETRRVLERAGVPSARTHHVVTLGEAQAAARAIGYPVVVKPRSLAGSIGVSLVAGPADLPAAFEVAAGSTFPGVAPLPGVLVEEYLDGDEVSVDCVLLDGRIELVTVAKKRLGFAPFFEETGHVVTAVADGSLPLEAIRAVVTAAHEALGFDRGVTHTELRLTPTGPRIVEVNARLGGDLIPLLGHLATGVDVAAATADVAAGAWPELAPTASGAAAIRFFYPDAAIRVRSVGLDPSWAVPAWLDRVCWEVSPGDVLRLPPDGFMSRLGFAIVTAASEVECEARLDEVERHLVVTSEPVAPLGSPPAGTWWEEALPRQADASPDHVFDTEGWLHAWERATTERHDARRYLMHESSAAVTPFYLVADSPMWNSYETDAGVGPVWTGPVASTPSLYAFYGSNTAPLDQARTIVERGLEQARGWGAEALVVGNLEPGVAASWAALAPPTIAMVLDVAYRADVTSGIDAHLAGMGGHARREFRRLWRRSVERGLSITALRGEAMLPRLDEMQVLAHATSSRHGPPLYTRETFAALSRVPGATLLVAEHEGHAVGAFLTFVHRDSLYLWAGGHDYARRAELATYSFLIYESIRFAVRSGCRFVEAGRGNFAFKARHGFTPTDLWSLIYLMPGARHDELHARLRAMDRGMRAHLPLEAAPLAAPALDVAPAGSVALEAAHESARDARDPVLRP